MKLAALRLPQNLGDIYFPQGRFTGSSPTEVVGTIVSWLLIFAGGFAALAIVYSGVMYITAGDDANKAATAKKNLTWAIIGIIVIVGANILVGSLMDLISGNLANQNTTSTLTIPSGSTGTGTTGSAATPGAGATITVPSTGSSGTPPNTPAGGSGGNINIGVPSSEINIGDISVDLPSANIGIPNVPGLPFNVNVRL